MTELWQRQPKERTKAYELFCLYRDMGSNRSLDKVHESHKKLSLNPITLRQIAEYSRKYRWVERANAYDDYLEELIRLEQEQALKDMIKRHANESMELQKDVLDLKNDPELSDLKLTQKVWLLNTTVNSYEKMALFERLSRGEPINHVKEESTQKHDVEVDIHDRIKERAKLYNNLNPESDGND